jgi:hypothetical protein
MGSSGETLTYEALAKLLGNPSTVRQAHSSGRTGYTIILRDISVRGELVEAQWRIFARASHYTEYGAAMPYENFDNTASILNTGINCVFGLPPPAFFGGRGRGGGPNLAQYELVKPPSRPSP